MTEENNFVSSIDNQVSRQNTLENSSVRHSKLSVNKDVDIRKSSAYSRTMNKSPIRSPIKSPIKSPITSLIGSSIKSHVKTSAKLSRQSKLKNLNTDRYGHLNGIICKVNALGK